MSESKKQKIAAFDQNGMGVRSNQIFGLPFTEDESDVVLVPVPWDVTVSYGGQTGSGPEAIREASYQVDLYDLDLPLAWQQGIAMQPVSASWAALSKELRGKASTYLDFLSEGGEVGESPEMQVILREINQGGERLRGWVRQETSKLLTAGKLVGLVGGDHSTPLGFLDALAEAHREFGILQIDAHCDLREAYEGFQYSHASIMWNALKIPSVHRLVQVGIRDFSEGEMKVIESSDKRVRTFFDSTLKRRGFAGDSWKTLCQEITAELPQKVYISFDIDGLDPKLCPNTGTPVPGGLEFEQAIYLLREVVNSGRKIIGFDLNEVSPGDSEWDANVGARMLYRLCGLLIQSGKA
jgi:agmatinase